jgi:hypothetical protein
VLVVRLKPTKRSATTLIIIHERGRDDIATLLLIAMTVIQLHWFIDCGIIALYCSIRIVLITTFGICSGFIPGFSTWVCNIMTGVPAKLGPHWGSVVWGCYKSAGGLTPQWGLEKCLFVFDVFYHAVLAVLD